jgi:hypothetical protein
MKIEANTKIKPIIKELDKIIPTSYLLSMHFQKCLISIDFDGQWKDMLDYLEENRGYYAPGEDFSGFDAKCAITLACNSYYVKLGAKHLLQFVLFLLDCYSSYSSKPIDVSELMEDFALLGLSETECAELKLFQDNLLNLDIPSPENMIKDGYKINVLRDKIEKAQKENDHNGVVTYSYTFLEGILKGTCNHFGVEYRQEEDINHLAGKVRTKIEEEYSDSLLCMTNASKQITNITNIVDKCRNWGSDSHFDKQSDVYIATFIHDEVYSLANLLLTIINNASQKVNS